MIGEECTIILLLVALKNEWMFRDPLRALLTFMFNTHKSFLNGSFIEVWVDKSNVDLMARNEDKYPKKHALEHVKRR